MPRRSSARRTCSQHDHDPADSTTAQPLHQSNVTSLLQEINKNARWTCTILWQREESQSFGDLVAAVVSIVQESRLWHTANGVAGGPLSWNRPGRFEGGDWMILSRLVSLSAPIGALRIGRVIRGLWSCPGSVARTTWYLLTWLVSYTYNHAGPYDMAM